MNADTYIGIIASFIGISVTMIIGYQIFSTLDFKSKISEFQNLYERLLLVEQNVEKMNAEVSESFDVFSAEFMLQKNGDKASLKAFQIVHNTLINSLNGNEEDDYEDILSLLNSYLLKIDRNCFGGEPIWVKPSGWHIKSIINDKPYARPLKLYIDEFKDDINKNAESIRSHKNFRVLKFKYERIISDLNSTLSSLLKNTEIEK